MWIMQYIGKFIVTLIAEFKDSFDENKNLVAMSRNPKNLSTLSVHVSSKGKEERHKRFNWEREFSSIPSYLFIKTAQADSILLYVVFKLTFKQTIFSTFFNNKTSKSKSTTKTR